MAGWPPKKNATFTWFFFIRDADGDPVVGATALDVQFSINGGAFAAVAGTEVDEGEGLYSCPITAAEMNGDIISLICKTSTGGAKTAAQVIYTGVRQIDDLAFPSVSGRNFVVETDGMIHVDLKEWRGAAPGVLITGFVQAFVSGMGTNVLNASAIAANAITATKIAAGAIGVSEAPNLDAAITSRAVAGDSMALTTAAINLIWDELISEARVAASYGQRIKDAVGLDTLTAARVGNLDNADVLTSSRAAPGALMGLVADAITAAKIATGAIGSDEFAQAAADKVWASATRNLTALGFTLGTSDFAAAFLTAALIATDAITAAKIAAGAIGASEAPNLDVAISSRATPAQVNAEVSDVIKTDTIAELPQAAPDATPTLEKAIMLLYMALRNKLDVDANFKEIHDNGGTVIAKKALSDDGTTYSEAEAVTGP